MNSIKLKEIVIKSLKKLCKNDEVLIDIAVKEECINHKLAQYIEEKVKEIVPEITPVNVDVEYNKYKKDPKKRMNQKLIRPDILVHKRQSGNRNNYLAIEAKKDYSSKHDEEKIQFLVANTQFDYSLGCLISYQPKRKYLIVKFLEKGRSGWVTYKYNKNPFKIINKNIFKGKDRGQALTEDNLA